MAKKSAGGPNKSEVIRKYKADNPKQGPKEISEALGKTGFKVSPAFISTVLSNARRKSGKPGRKRGRVAKASVTASKGGFGDLIHAKRLVDQIGSVEQAKAALDALAKILNS
jgi:hypothetical protein